MRMSELERPRVRMSELEHHTLRAQTQALDSGQAPARVP
jgi:hypothetical protein